MNRAGSAAGERLRALFVCVPASGHFNPLVPIARALLDAGHEVAFATTADFCEVPAALEFPTFSFGVAGPIPIACVFQPTAIDRLSQLIVEWDANVVVHDHVAAPAAVAGDRVGIPNAYVGVGIMRSVKMTALVDQAMVPLWTAHGLPVPPLAGLYRYLYLDRCPPSLQRPEITEIATAHAIQPVSYDHAIGIDVPDWLNSLPRKPTVYVTLGTQFNAPELFMKILDGLRSHTDLNVIVTIGVNNDPAALGAQPPHVRVERFIPQSAIMARADLVICHAGSGAIMGALTAGLAMLLLPQGADQTDNAPRCVDRSVARQLAPEQVTATAIQHETHTLLDDASYRLAAEAVAAEIRQLPGTASTVPLIKQLVSTHLPVLRN